MKRKIIFSLCVVCLTSCTVGPNYVKPSAPVPTKFKEAKRHWKIAEPCEAFDRGEWWRIFHDPSLNSLEAQLIISNQSVATIAAQYQQAIAQVDEARAAYFPTLGLSAAVTRSKNAASSSGTSTQILSGTGSGVTTNHSWLLNASWEPDIWGGIRRTVEASATGAQAENALLALTRLSSQASLAQFYFELRALDKDQKILDDTVKQYRQALQLTKNQYASGVAAELDVLQAQTQLDTARAAAINNGILRGQYEHAIAILIGKPPGDFSLAFKPLNRTPPTIPIEVPSLLLERRPDIAQAERLMAQANAQVGVAIYAYFPVLTISASASYQHRGWEKWFSMPNIGWSIGPQIAETILDGGLRSATVRAARANYDATVASYRQIVLAAFQDVEDNLVSLRILKAQSVVEDKAALEAKRALKITLNEYKAGTVAYASVITAQVAAFTAEKTAADVKGLEMSSAVGLIKALGGGWTSDEI